MTSAIDATKPIDGVPAVKSDLRANLQTAANEITELQTAVAPGAGTVGRTVSETVGDYYNLLDLGAVGDGTIHPIQEVIVIPY